MHFNLIMDERKEMEHDQFRIMAIDCNQKIFYISRHLHSGMSSDNKYLTPVGHENF